MRWLLIAVLLFPCASWAQPLQIQVPLPHQVQGSGVVDHWRLDHSGTSDPDGANLWFSFDQVIPLDHQTVPLATGQTATIHGLPVAVHDGTWPGGGTPEADHSHKWNFSGSWIDSTIPVPTGDFTFACYATPDVIVDGSTAPMAWYTGGNLAALVYTISGSPRIAISDDGSWDSGHYSVIAPVAPWVAGLPKTVAFSYDYITDGTSVGIFKAGSVITTKSDMNGPINQSGPPFSLAGFVGSGNSFSGKLHRCAIWNGTPLTVAQLQAIECNWEGHYGCAALPAPTFEIKFSQTPGIDGSTITADTGQQLTQKGVPVKMDDAIRDYGLGGAPGWGWQMTGVGNYAVVPGVTVGPNAFTAACVITPTLTDSSMLMSKDGVTRGPFMWRIQTNGTMVIDIWDDDGDNVQFTSGAYLKKGVESFVAWTYYWSGTGTATLSAYVDENTLDQSLTDIHPLRTTSNSMYFGERTEGGGYDLRGVAHDCKTWNRALSATELAQKRAQWRGVMSGGGVPLIATLSATPPAVMVAPPDSTVEPFLVRSPANTPTVGSPALGNVKVAVSQAMESVIYHGALCETPDGSNHPTGFSVEEVPGTGTASLECSTERKAAGDYSVKSVTTGTGWTHFTGSTCMTTGIGVDLWVLIREVSVGATPESVLVRVREFDAANCTSTLGYINVYSGSGATTWTNLGGKVAAATWNASTSSYWVDVVIQNPGTSYWDELYVGVTNPGDSSCTCDVEATCTCTVMRPQAGPLAGPALNSPFTVGFTVRPTVVQSGTRYMYFIDTTNSAMQFEADGGNQYVSLWASDGDMDYLHFGTAPTLNTDANLRGFYYGTASSFAGKLNSTFSRGIIHFSGPALPTGDDPYIQLGGYFDGWIGDITLYRKAME